jgi:curved DNA-binding protein CbpA
VSQEEIETHYKTLNNKYNPAFNPDPANIVKFKKIHEAYECLKGFQCRIQYKKFGSYIQSLSSNNNQQDSQKDPLTNLDIRMASSLVFYFTFALLASAMSTTEVTLLRFFKHLQQKQGLRYALALAVVFCLSEIQWLQEVAKLEQTGKITILSFLPSNLCLFEKVILTIFATI